MKLYAMTCLLAIGCLSIPAKAHDDQTIQPTIETTTQDSLDSEAPKGIISQAKAYITKIKNDHPLVVSIVGSLFLGAVLTFTSNKVALMARKNPDSDMRRLCYLCYKLFEMLFPLGCASFDNFQIIRGASSQISTSMIAIQTLCFSELIGYIFYLQPHKNIEGNL